MQQLGGVSIIAPLSGSLNIKAYPEVLKTLAKVIDGTPKVQTGEVVNSTFQ